MVLLHLLGNFSCKLITQLGRCHALQFVQALTLKVYHAAQGLVHASRIPHFSSFCCPSNGVSAHIQWRSGLKIRLVVATCQAVFRLMNRLTETQARTLTEMLV